MPIPPLPSLTTMIGSSFASAEFDFRRPRHIARKPLTELAPPTSTANSVRWMAGLEDVVWDESGSVDADVTISAGAKVLAAAFSGSSNFAAAASGGAISDGGAISGGAGEAADMLDAADVVDDTLAGPWSVAAVVSMAGFSAILAALVTMLARAEASWASVGFWDVEVGSVAGEADAAICGGAGLRLCRAGVSVSGFGVVVATGVTRGAGPGFCGGEDDSGVSAPVAVIGGGPVLALCREGLPAAGLAAVAATGDACGACAGTGDGDGGCGAAEVVAACADAVVEDCGPIAPVSGFAAGAASWIDSGLGGLGGSCSGAAASGHGVAEF
jgi:hypothetical protein